MTDKDAGLVERVARAIAPRAWQAKDDGGRGISLDSAIDHSLDSARAALEAIVTTPVTQP